MGKFLWSLINRDILEIACVFANDGKRPRMNIRGSKSEITVSGLEIGNLLSSGAKYVC